MGWHSSPAASPRQDQVLLGSQAESRSPSSWVMTGLLLCPLHGTSQPKGDLLGWEL